MSWDTASAAGHRVEGHLGGTVAETRGPPPPPPPEIRVDDLDAAAAKLNPPSAADASDDPSWLGCGGEHRRRSMPASHGRFVDEPYVFSLSQALALSARRRSEPAADAQPRDTSESPVSPQRRGVVDQLTSGGKLALAEPWKVSDQVDRRSSGGATPKTPSTTTTPTLPSLDELSRLQQSPVDDPNSDHFLSLPQTSDYLTVPARRHSVALVQPIPGRLLDVIAEEAVATDSKNLASSRRYSLSCQLNT